MFYNIKRVSIIIDGDPLFTLKLCLIIELVVDYVLECVRFAVSRDAEPAHRYMAKSLIKLCSSQAYLIAIDCNRHERHGFVG